MPLQQWFLLCSVFIAYLVLGGLLFMNLERENEKKENFQLAALRQDIQVVLFQMDYEFYRNDTSKEQLREIQVAKEAILKRIFAVCGGTHVWDPTAHPSKWGFYNSVFYGFTIVTTIGYGHMMPTNDWSRLSAVLYALIGIPLNGILLSTLGDYFSGQLIKAHQQSKDGNKIVMVIKVGVYFLSGVILFFFVPAALISSMEKWTFVESIYFAIISLTTVGFGDFIAGKQMAGRNIGIWSYKVFIIVWIELGLGYLIMILAFIGKGLRHNKLQSVITKTIDSTKEQLFKDLEDMRHAMEAEFQLDNKSIKFDDEKSRTRALMSNLLGNVNATAREGMALQSQLFSTVSRLVKDVTVIDNRSRSVKELERQRQGFINNSNLPPQQQTQQIFSINGENVVIPNEELREAIRKIFSGSPTKLSRDQSVEAELQDSNVHTPEASNWVTGVTTGHTSRQSGSTRAGSESPNARMCPQEEPYALDRIIEHIKEDRNTPRSPENNGLVDLDLHQKLN